MLNFIGLMILVLLSSNISANDSAQVYIRDPFKKIIGNPDFRFPDYEYVSQKIIDKENPDINLLLYLEKDLFHKSVNSFDKNVRLEYRNIGNKEKIWLKDVFIEDEKLLLNDLVSDFNIAKVISVAQLIIILADGGFLIYNMGRALNGNSTPSEQTMQGLSWFGIGIGLALFIPVTIFNSSSKRKFKGLINYHNYKILSKK